MSIGLIKHNKYYYLIVGKLLRILDGAFHFVFYKCGVQKLLKIATGHWKFRPMLSWNGASDYEYLMTYKALKCGEPQIGSTGLNYSLLYKEGDPGQPNKIIK